MFDFILMTELIFTFIWYIDISIINIDIVVE